MAKRIILSICITLCVSLAIGFVFQDIFNSFWRGTVCSVIIHFIIFYIIGSRTQPKDNTQNTLDEIINLQTCPVSCPCGKNIFDTVLFINAENIFTCDKCQSKFKVEVAYDSILLTEPVSLNNVFTSLKENKQ
jgi:hypothetical protein